MSGSHNKFHSHDDWFCLHHIQTYSWSLTAANSLDTPLFETALCRKSDGQIGTIDWYKSKMVPRKRHQMELVQCQAMRLPDLPSNLLYKSHLSRQWTCWSLRCSWIVACRRCSNYIFVLELTPGFNGLSKDNCKARRETFKFLDLVRLILEDLRYVFAFSITSQHWDVEGIWNPPSWMTWGPFY